jgi:nitroreductase
MTGGQAFLDFLRTRRSVRQFSDAPIDRGVLERVVEAAITAPSSTNRQPWRFTVVTGARERRAIVESVRARTEMMKVIIRKSHHAEEFGSYGDFFFEPLETAAAIVVPQYREYPDQLAHFIASGGGDPSAFPTAASMQAELCGASAAVMLLLLQAHAEGLGACWMAGPMVARDDIHAIVGVRDPYKMVGAIALGHPAAPPGQAPARRGLDKVVRFLEDAGPEAAGAAEGEESERRDGRGETKQ